MSHTKQLFAHEGLTIYASHTSGRLTLIFHGVSDAKEPAPFFRTVQSALLPELRGKSVVLDFRLLEFMNSSTLGCIMLLIKELDARGIATLVRFDAQVDWQRINGQCMKAISRSLRNLSVESN